MINSKYKKLNIFDVIADQDIAGRIELYSVLKLLGGHFIFISLYSSGLNGIWITLNIQKVKRHACNADLGRGVLIIHH